MGLRGPRANPLPAALRRRALFPDLHKQFACEACGKTFITSRIDAKFCSNKCRQQHYRDRRAVALREAAAQRLTTLTDD